MRFLYCFLCLFQFSLINTGLAQELANEITKLDRGFCIFAESVWHEDTLLVAGNSGIFPTTLDATIVKYNKNGSINSHFFLPDSSTAFSFIFGYTGLIVEEEKMTHIVNKAFDNNESEAFIASFDLSGNFIDSASFKNYYYPLKNRVTFTDFKKIPVGYIVSEISWKDHQDAQSCLRLIDNSFDEIWHRCFGNESREAPKQVFPLSNGHFVVISNSTDLEDDTYYGSGNGFYRGYIFEVDEEGSLKWEWRSPDRSEATYAGFLQNDSTLIVASGMGEEVCTDPGNPNSLCRILWTGGVYKFNLLTKEKVWETRLSGGPIITMFDNCYLDIIPSIEKDGYILSGAGYDQIPDCRTDTIDKCWANPGVIAKVSNNGDSLWLRKYFGVTDIFESNRLSDVEITPDLGYSFVGEAFDGWPGLVQGQFGWLLMTDQFGCLIPGCHLMSSNNKIENDLLSTKEFKVYPNPISNEINVLITNPLTPKTTLKLYNSIGIELDSWNNFQVGGTYIIPADHLYPGVYYLSMIERGKIMGIEKIFKVE